MVVHETHTCRDCAAEITLPYARPGQRYGCLDCGSAFDDLDRLAEHDHGTHGEPVRYVVDERDDDDIYQPDFLGPHGLTYRMVDIPVEGGVATLPDGRTVSAVGVDTVRLPILVEPDAEELDPGSPWNIAGVDR